MEAEGGQRLSPEAITRRCLQGYSLAEDATVRGCRWQRLSFEGYRCRLSLDAVREAVRWQRMPLAEAIVGGCRRRLSLDAVRWQRMPLAEAIVWRLSP